MKSSEIRKSFIEFFKERAHQIVPSAPLVPKDDPTLLFTAAGMVQFKPLWAGTVPLSYKRAVSFQKCLRASDIEQAGKTIKHHTFFEMFGNFSFGDYFKEEAIGWAWEYLLKVVGLNKTRLAVSVFTTDDEAYLIWQKGIGLEPGRIFRLGDKDNFWGPVGGTGACGPCSEIYYDMGAEFDCGKKTCRPGCDCERWIEIWNIVFPQFNQQPDGSRKPLKNRGVDTGGGLERLAMVSQHKKSSYHTDVFNHLIQAASDILEKPYGKNRMDDIAIQTIVDHIRGLVFAIGDGVLPSNEERGYVIRRILRRALLAAKRLEIEQPFLYRLAGEVVEVMRPFYPELVEKREQTALIIKSEEERFLKTLDEGLVIVDRLLNEYSKEKVIPGVEVFKLHDTYGFPRESTEEIVKEKGFAIGQGYEEAMAEQRVRSRKSKEYGVGSEAATMSEKGDQKFVGYENDEAQTELLSINALEKGTYEVVLSKTPFYAEAGGQKGDQGTITGTDFELTVLDTYYKQGVSTNKVKVKKGMLKEGQVKAVIDKPRRREIERAHTTTHLLHAALRKTLGEHARQEGSLVEPGRFRFDFTSFEPVTQEQLSKIEKLVYEKILEDIEVEKFEKSLAEAKEMGALAFFGEQYGEQVQVIKIGDFSMELCGGTHLRRTGEIGLFKIISETGIAAGIRRIEAAVGERAYAAVKAERKILEEISENLGVGEELLNQRLQEILEKDKKSEARIKKLASEIANRAVKELIESAREINNIKVITGTFDFFETADLRLLVDRIKEKEPKNVAGLLFSTLGERATYVCFVSDDLTKKVQAGKIAQEIGKVLAGGGGGRPDLAEGGGKKDKISEGIETFKKRIAGL
jgi:alanyl-tRNA synthetase